MRGGVFGCVFVREYVCMHIALACTIKKMLPCFGIKSGKEHIDALCMEADQA